MKFHFCNAEYTYNRISFSIEIEIKTFSIKNYKNHKMIAFSNNCF